MIVGVTGHRDVVQEPGELLMFARLSVALMIERGCTEIITGMARGWDLKIAKAAMDAGLPYVAALPFPSQPNHWPKADQEDWAWCIQGASRVHVQSRLALNSAYIGRDRWIVDHCDELWALDSGRRSGTHTTVLYAQEVRRTVRPLWEPWLRFRAERT